MELKRSVKRKRRMPAVTEHAPVNVDTFINIQREDITIWKVALREEGVD